ncbi:MAG: hypothetical protein Q8O25_14810 [Sulfurisoma sp.]|nr:hypothetical protein [Sulfurisoma sp.]
MLRYLLDTDICSYAIKRKQSELLEKIRAGLMAEEIAISAIMRRAKTDWRPCRATGAGWRRWAYRLLRRLEC